ncbi:MAG: phage major capsid protein [Actinobacteria bacterium]|nr:phage major capsid protein [Actinomycetota bacterium]
MALSRASFDGITVPDEVRDSILSTLVGGAPFGRSLPVLRTVRGTIAFPIAAPSGQGWVAENQPLPTVTLNDDSYVIGVAKIAGLIAMSNESMTDSVLDQEAAVGAVLKDTLSADLDDGLLNGTGIAPIPAGVIGRATSTTGTFTDMRSGVIASIGELIDAGADPSAIKVYANGLTVAPELAREGTAGPIYTKGVDGLPYGAQIVPAQKMGAAEVLVVDTTRCWLVTHDDFEVAVSGEAGFANDQTLLRIKGRFNVATPVPGKALRTFTVS